MPISSNYVNMGFFSYDGGKAISTADAGQRTLVDWNRQLTADKTCSYFINGVKLSEIRAQLLKNGACQQLEFANIDELKQFFKDHLFKSLPEERAELAVTQASLQWHQAGIQHATYQHTRAYTLEHFPNVQISEPEYYIHFVSTADGASITESNIYREWVEVDNGSLNKHAGDEKKGYCAQTSTTYLFTPESIQIEGMAIDCPDQRLAQIFDIQPEKENLITYVTNSFFRALYAFIALFYSGYTQVPTIEQEEPQTSFTHPRLK